MDFELELDKVIERVKKENSKIVGIQLPDGIKHHANKVQEEIETKTDAKCIIWAGSCYGACDLAVDMKRLGVDLLVQWGHTEWKYGSIF